MLICLSVSLNPVHRSGEERDALGDKKGSTWADKDHDDRCCRQRDDPISVLLLFYRTISKLGVFKDCWCSKDLTVMSDQCTWINQLIAQNFIHPLAGEHFSYLIISCFLHGAQSIFFNGLQSSSRRKLNRNVIYTLTSSVLVRLFRIVFFYVTLLCLLLTIINAATSFIKLLRKCAGSAQHICV